MNNRRYDVIYADPPWFESGGGKCRRGADRHYPLMHTKDICNLPIPSITNDNAHCYLWVTNNFLPDGLEVMKAWGFRYITKITWFKGTVYMSYDDVYYKAQVGLGQYFRGCTEDCLFGVKGNLPYRVGEDGKRKQGVTGFIEIRGEHSVKPVTMRKMIEDVSCFEGANKIELFARTKVAGWDVWGNGVDSTINL